MVFSLIGKFQILNLAPLMCEPRVSLLMVIVPLKVNLPDTGRQGQDKIEALVVFTLPYNKANYIRSSEATHLGQLEPGQ